MSTCAILLAAGKSTRMKSLKQLLEWERKSLLEYQIDKLSALEVKEVVVILGHESEKLRKNVKNIKANVTFLECQNYEDGLSASLKCGLSYASRSYRSVLIMLLDLPLIQFHTIDAVLKKGSLLMKHERETFSVQPTYMNKKGHPVFIGNFFLVDWGSLQGDMGAKPLLKQMNKSADLSTNDTGIFFDIDTDEDYKKALEFRRKYEEVNRNESSRITNSL